MLQPRICYLLVLALCSIVGADKPKLLDKSTLPKQALGGDISMSCTFESSVPGFKLTWLKNGQPVQKEADRVFMQMLASQQGMLVVNKLRTTDKATYTCRGRNDNGVTDGTIVLDLYELKPKIQPIPKIYLRPDQGINISCLNEAVPAATAKWMKKNGLFSDNVVEHKDGLLEIKKLKDTREVYTCTATNVAGSDQVEVEVELVGKSPIWIDEPKDTNVTLGSSFTYTLSFATRALNPKVTWFKNYLKLPKVRYEDTWRRVGAKYTSELYFEMLDTSNTGLYRAMINFGQISPFEKHGMLTVWAKPEIKIDEATAEDGNEIYREEGDDVELTCIVHAYPLAQLQWEKNSTVLIKSNKDNTEVNEFRTSFTLKLPSVSETGFYTCSGVNSRGSASVTVKVNVAPAAGSGGTSRTTIIAVVVASIVAIFIIILVAIIYVKYHERFCISKYTKANGQFYTDVIAEEKDVSNLEDFEKNPNAIKKNINISIKRTDRTNSIGYRPNETVKGRSLRQTLKGMSVKRPSQGAIENTYARLDTMVTQGKAIDFKSIVFDESLGQGEYGHIYGGRIIEDENATVFKECSIKMLKDDWTAEQRRDMLAELRMMRRIAKHRNVTTLMGWCITDDNVYVLEEFAPFGSLLEFVRAQRSIHQSREELDQLSQEDRVDTNTLLSFASQIASGMNHLEQLQVIHRDLACRNVYLSFEKTCKIADFGLTRDIYAENVYRKITGGQLPVRWMAKESIFEGQYTHKSDVWSFGILLWELVNLGKIPYPGLVRTEHLLTELEQGYHMENPGHISTDIYLLMSQCWNDDPDRRPSFEKLERKINGFMDDEEEVHIDLSKMLQTEIDEELACDDELIKSPTEDYHRPKVHFSSFCEEDEDKAAETEKC